MYLHVTLLYVFEFHFSFTFIFFIVTFRFSLFSVQRYIHLVPIIFVNSTIINMTIITIIWRDEFFLFFCWLDRFYGTFVTQRELAGPVTCLAHWILFNGSVLYSVPCSVPLSTYLHTLLYIALFVTACPKKFLFYRPEK